jgi:transcription antitermination factor NusG
MEPAIVEAAVPEMIPAPGLPGAYVEPRWYAAHTCSRHEKTVAQQLEQRGVTCFLPLYRAIHRWKDRDAAVQLPLFPGYIFVRIALRDRLAVLTVPGLVRLIGFGGLPMSLPDREFERLRLGLAAELCVQPHPYLKLGQRVRVTSGPFEGLEGILKRKNENFRLVLTLDLIMRSVVLDIDGAQVEPVN